ncbi:MAG: dTDP-4-dehydrorhamnose 3,5-epimerase [Cetobacterium sp.]
MIKGLVLIEPKIFSDERGFFFEFFNLKELEKHGIKTNFVQGNHSKSGFGVLRGLHFQTFNPQAKLIRVLKGEILDVVVDLRAESETFGETYKVILSSENRKLLYIPERFGHGFLSLSSDTEIEYLCSDYYSPTSESGILWNDTDLDIDWNLEEYGLCINDLIISEKDRRLGSFKEFTLSLKEIER